MTFLDQKHFGEFARALRNLNFEKVDDNQLYFPEQKCFLGGSGAISRNFGPMEMMDNLVVLQGRLYLLNAGLLGGAQNSAWYIAPYASNAAVPDTLTAANFNSTLVEFTNYQEAVRQQWSGQTPTTTSTITNAGHLATITISNGAQTGVYGATLQTQSAIGATTGTCFCGMLAPSPKLNLEQGETLSFTYGISATST